MRSNILRLSHVFALTILLSAAAFAQPLTVRQIMAEPSIAGMRASGVSVSPDGTKAAFYWNAAGQPRRDLYIVPTAGGAPQKILSYSDLPAIPRPPQRPNPLDYGVAVRDEFNEAREGQLGGISWSPDSQKLIFSHGGDIFLMTLSDRSLRRLTNTQPPEMGARILKDGRIFFVQSGNAFIMDTAEMSITQVNRQGGQPTGPNVSAGFVNLNDQGTRASYVVSDTSKYRTLVVPNFVPEFVQAQNIRRGWAEQKLFIAETGANRLTAHEIKLPAHEGVSSFRRSTWTPDGAHLLVDRLDRDTKRRQLFYVRNAGTSDEKVILVTEETDDKWQAALSNIFEPHPTDPNKLFFASERDGYSHLYLATVDPEAGTTDIRQLTNGNWQVEWARWTNAGQILYSSTEAGYTGRELYLLDPASGRKAMLESPEKGMKDNFTLSENQGEQVVLFEHSKWNQPGDVYAQRVCSPCSKPNVPVRLTNTVPKEFMARKWQVPQFIEIDSSDGKKIPAKIYLPAGFDKRKKYPMAIFVHGAGYLQNVINGWNNYYREFMFNQILTDRGYVVLDIDYRGSAGYGRDWRTDVHDFLGGKDYDDHIDSIDHMVANYAVDPTKVGVYGGSYGGFMAGMLVMRAPDKIAAAAALRSVFDWKNYYATNPGYTAQRLGFPDKNAEAYKRSSPITYADQLERPLLILHGMVDDNVHVQDSVQLIEKLIRLGKTKHFEAMMYPSESHAFVRPESWADEYERILWFFERHVERR